MNRATRPLKHWKQRFFPMCSSLHGIKPNLTWVFTTFWGYYWSRKLVTCPVWLKRRWLHCSYAIRVSHISWCPLGWTRVSLGWSSRLISFAVLTCLWPGLKWERRENPVSSLSSSSCIISHLFLRQHQLGSLTKNPIPCFVRRSVWP